MYQLLLVLDDQKYIYFGVGTFIVLAAILLIFIIKDVVNEENEKIV